MSLLHVINLTDDIHNENFGIIIRKQYANSVFTQRTLPV